MSTVISIERFDGGLLELDGWGLASTFFTIDPSGYVDTEADSYSAPQLQLRYDEISGEAAWMRDYIGQRIPLATGTTLVLDENICRKAAVFARMLLSPIRDSQALRYATPSFV